jgi:Glycosyl transferase family 2
VSIPRFSVIAVDYEYHVSRQGMRNGLQSLANQTFKDFELIYVHDGPKNVDPREEFDFGQFYNDPVFLNTPEHMADWGHSSRDLGMRHANGEYFINFNIDNVFYPYAFQKIHELIWQIEQQEVQQRIIIFQIKHWKAAGGAVFTGLPPTHCHIDVMQLVAHRDIWENIGYWYTKEGTSDGIIYERMCKEYPWATLDECLGDNF